jgi:hypothetical protein
MSSILSWISKSVSSNPEMKKVYDQKPGNELKDKEIEDDWCLFEEIPPSIAASTVEDDMSSSIATIEQINVTNEVLAPGQKPMSIRNGINASNLSAIHTNIARLTAANAERQKIPRINATLANLKDKELKERKMQKINNKRNY